MDERNKLVFFQLCRAALRNFVPAGEIADEMLFGAQEAIAQHELHRLNMRMQRQIKLLVERLDSLEGKANEVDCQKLVATYIPSLLEYHKSHFGEVFHKLGKVEQSYDCKVREFGERFLNGDAGEFLEETGLGAQFPHLSKEVLRHLSGEGVLADLYELGPEIDRGGMSQVFTAVRKGTGERRALKRFVANGRGMLERFLIEGFVGKNFLHSDYLVSTFDFGGFLNSGDYFIECELLSGQNLSRWLRSHPYRGPEDPHLRLVGQMLEGLRYLHSQGFIHRDVKPANFFLTDSGRVKMLDFGIIKSLRHRMADAGLTYTNQSLGTPAFKAPEQIDPVSFGPISEKTDIYSLGATMFELLTGQPLFQGSRVEIERQHMFQEPPRPSQFNIALTAEVDALILACLEKDPDKRPTLDEVVALLPPPPALDEKTGFLESLCWEGLRHREEIVSQLQTITEYEVGNLGPIASHVKKARIHRFKERVLSQLHSRVHTSRKLLWRVREELATWNPRDFGERCPNLLCGKERPRGSRECPSCHANFTEMVCDNCKKPTSYFSDRCQRGLCAAPLNKDPKLRYVVKTTTKHALLGSEQESAKALLVLSHLLSEQFQWHPDTESLERMESLRLRFAQANRIFQSEQVKEYRNALRKLVDTARDEYCREQKIQSQDTLKETYWLIDEGRVLDAHRELGKIPRLIWDSELELLEDRINQALTQDELKMVEDLLIKTQPDKARVILEGLPYDCQQRRRLLERTRQLQRALANTEPRPKMPTTLPMTPALVLHHRVLPRTATLVFLASAFVTSGLAYWFLWSKADPNMMKATLSLGIMKKVKRSMVEKPAIAPPLILPEPPKRRKPRSRSLFVLPRKTGYHLDRTKNAQLQRVRFQPRILRLQRSRRLRSLRTQRCTGPNKLLRCRRRCLQHNRKGLCIRRARQSCHCITAR